MIPQDALDQPGDRRAKPRLYCSYPVVVRGRQVGGDKFEAQAVITNISASGMYLRLQNFIPRGEILFLVTRLSSAPPDQRAAPNIAAKAEVVRVEPKPDGAYGVAVKLQRHRFV